MKNKLPTAGCRLLVEKPESPRRFFQIANRKSQIANGFTLIELLVVISIIGVLAAFTVPVLSVVKRRQYISQTQAEMGQLQTAIDSYHATYGFYPPDNPNGVTDASGELLGNQLYYELAGTTNTSGAFCVIGNPGDQLGVTPVNQVQAAFGVAGFVNCSKLNAGEDSQPAKNFIHELKPGQTGSISNSTDTVRFTILVASVGGPDSTYQPLGVSGLNPWRYVSSNPTNNPGGYELYVQLVISGQTNLVCNWNKQVQINNPLP